MAFISRFIFEIYCLKPISYHKIHSRSYGNFEMKISFIILTVFTLLIPVQIPAQLNINLPDSIVIIVDRQIQPLSKTRLDSLRKEAGQGKVHYKIAAIESSQKEAQVRLFIPQILSQQQVCDQVIFYYSLISTEDDRLRDRLYIYPYFSNIEEKPYISCNYQPHGKFIFTVNRWPVVAVPHEPDQQQKYIYNQIINESMEDFPVLENIDPGIIKKIASKNKLSPEQVQKIYENTVLWQETQ